MKIFIIFSILMTFSTYSCLAQEFKHARPDTTEMLVESLGMLEVTVEKCNLSSEQREKVLISISDMQEVIHFYDSMSYEVIKTHQQQSKVFYTKNFINEYCSQINEVSSEIVKMPERFILEQLYSHVQNIPQKDLANLNKDYIYKNKFLSKKFSGYNAGQNQDKTVWIGKLMNMEDCNKKEQYTKDSSMPTYCDQGYAKINVFIP